MKWGRRRSKKPASSSSVSSSSHRFPSLSSWSSMFKRMSMNSKQKPVEKVSNGVQQVRSSVSYGGGAGDEANLDSSCRICGERIISSSSIQVDAGMERYINGKEMMIKTPRLIDEDCLRAKKSAEGVKEGKRSRSERSVGVVPVIGMGNLKLQEDDLLKKRVKDIRVKQRKSVHVSKGKAFSPRTEICRIKALEDMKKAKLKMKTKEANTRTVKERTGLENFAMVKFSADPEKDFRDSMVEMIVEKRICESEELEALLACYLTLNSDDYHDLIIKVFREVWTKLDEARFEIEFLNQQSLHDFLVSSS